jgi:NTP pyrophosphatase (non-canonical NTP hydrolase)
MDKDTTIDELKNTVQDFCEKRDWDQYHNPKDLSIGILTEASELIELFRFKDLEEIEQLFDDPKKYEDIKRELADVFFFILRFAQMNNIDLSDALESKIKINKFKYPTDLFKGSNKKYDEI